MNQEFNPRKEGKAHWHEEIVRPSYVTPENIAQKNPLKDMYYDAQDRKHKIRDVTLPMRTMNIHISEIEPGQKTRAHKHHNEAIVYIMQGKGYSLVQGEKYEWEAGDFLYIPVFNWHQHFNTGEENVYFMGITNKRMLDWLGLDRKVEAGVHVTEEEMQEEIAAKKHSPYSWYKISPEEGVKFGKQE